MTNCNICKKQDFYNKKQFFQAHGKPKPAEIIWILKALKHKSEPILVYLWVCKECKQEDHTKKCKYYSSSKPITIQREIFNWEEYWKWWFGVLTLDWESERFFGQYGGKF